MGLIACKFDGEAFRPATARMLKSLQEQFTAGETVQLEQVHERSPNSHRHFFAQIRDAWMNLPERLAMEFPTEDHLRKRALISTGFFSRRDFVCASRAEAIRTAGVVRSISEYALVVIEGNVVTELTADSQAYGRMASKQFKASKDAVLAYVWGLCGVDAATGEINTGQAA